jgi:hypothetical protein
MVTGTVISVLPGSIDINPYSGVTTGTTLTAVYNGSESVTYQWNKDGSAISGAASRTYTPAEAGSYTVTVSAAGYLSKTSATVTVTASIKPGTPTGVTATAQSSSSISISWAAPSSDGTLTGYNIWRSTSDSSGYTEIDTVTASTTSYTDIGLSPATTYYYKVDAKNDVGDRSAESSYASATTPAAPAWTTPVTVKTLGYYTKYDDNTLSSISSVVWYKMEFPYSVEMKIMARDRQAGWSGKTADIVVSLYRSDGTVSRNKVNLGTGDDNFINGRVGKGAVYYIKVEVNPSSRYAGTYTIIVDENMYSIQ